MLPPRRLNRRLLVANRISRPLWRRRPPGVARRRKDLRPAPPFSINLHRCVLSAHSGKLSLGGRRYSHCARFVMWQASTRNLIRAGCRERTGRPVGRQRGAPVEPASCKYLRTPRITGAAGPRKVARRPRRHYHSPHSPRSRRAQQTRILLRWKRDPWRPVRVLPRIRALPEPQAPHRQSRHSPRFHPGRPRHAAAQAGRRLWRPRRDHDGHVEPTSVMPWISPIPSLTTPGP